MLEKREKKGCSILRGGAAVRIGSRLLEFTGAMLLAVIAAAPNVSAQAQAPAARSDAGKSVELTLTEGTWMSVDVSPDGKTIAFDLLNDIYVMPAAGGE